jgi:hypothetical protein
MINEKGKEDIVRRKMNVMMVIKMKYILEKKEMLEVIGMRT